MTEHAKKDMKKQGFNPYLPSWEYVPDGEPKVFGGKYYLYYVKTKVKGNRNDNHH